MKGKVIKLKKGYDIKILGEAEKTIQACPSRLYALKPTDFHGVAPIPKVMVTPGETVQAGDPIFFDKANPDTYYASPVSGEFVEIRRGEKRAIESLVILADKDLKYKDFGKKDPTKMAREALVSHLKESGAWVHLRQRPYGIVADATETPKGIFISCFDSAPLAPDSAFVLEGTATDFQTGIHALAKLTDGAVHLGLNAKATNTFFENITGVKHHYFEGPHPAGNVGIQIHHISPLNKGETVWTIDMQDVVLIGKLFNEGIYDPVRIVALTGAGVKKPAYFKMRLGASVEEMLKGNLKEDNVRIISGDVLTGNQIEPTGFLGFFDDQITVIEEGNEPEIFGWLFPTYPRPSISSSFVSNWFRNKKFDVNTNTHGEQRAFAVTGVYEKVMPMDLLPMQLFKSILYQDFDEMEGLGIYEVLEEDVALCEFVCPSKQPIQEILRDGLDLLRAQG